MFQSRAIKGIFDKSNDKGTLRKYIVEEEQDTENVKGILDHNTGPKVAAA